MEGRQGGMEGRQGSLCSSTQRPPAECSSRGRACQGSVAPGNDATQARQHRAAATSDTTGSRRKQQEVLNASWKQQDKLFSIWSWQHGAAAAAAAAAGGAGHSQKMNQYRYRFIHLLLCVAGDHSSSAAGVDQPGAEADWRGGCHGREPCMRPANCCCRTPAASRLPCFEQLAPVTALVTAPWEGCCMLLLSAVEMARSTA
jgi:hypothetical protein